MDLGFQAREGRSIRRRKNPDKYPYSTNKLSTKINTQNHFFFNTLRCNYLPTKTKYKIILFLKSINCGKRNLFSQTKTYFYYFNIAFEISRTVVFLIFGVLNTKYLPFRTPDTNTLILG